MRRAAKIDDNQNEIVYALRNAGCSVVSLAAVGKGCPDILVGRAAFNYLLEIKDGEKPASARKLRPEQKDFFITWHGHVRVVNNVDEALAAVGL